jgi:prepilin-type processing-associated H-X9-DG protein
MAFYLIWSKIKDGAATTLLLAENIHKTYSDRVPLFGWVGPPSTINFPSKTRVPPVQLRVNEQEFGMVWVVNRNPAPGMGIENQEQINGNAQDLPDFDFTMPRFARPAGPHGDGVNVVFADGHGQFLRADINYDVYQRLMTPDGRKCVDPLGHAPISAEIDYFQTRPPLSDADYQ